MGTNYYIKNKTCKECGQGGDSIHLGKSSAGWMFAFQWHGGDYYTNIDEMKKFLKGKQIWDEYGTKVSNKQFWELVEAKQKTRDPEPTECLIIDGYKFYENDFS